MMDSINKGIGHTQQNRETYFDGKDLSAIDSLTDQGIIDTTQKIVSTISTNQVERRNIENEIATHSTSIVVGNLTSFPLVTTIDSNNNVITVQTEKISNTTLSGEKRLQFFNMHDKFIPVESSSVQIDTASQPYMESGPSEIINEIVKDKIDY